MCIGQGETRPDDAVDATMRNASAVVVVILNDIGRKRQAHHSQHATVGREGEMSKLDKDLETHRAEFTAADMADVQLLEAVCLPALKKGIDKLRKDGAHATLPLLCAELLNVRDAAEGRSLLVLAAGAGIDKIVKLLLEIAVLAPNLVKTDATSFRGSNALHEAAACEHKPTCQLLLRQTTLLLHGPAASRHSDRRTPLEKCSQKFGATLQAIDRSSVDDSIYVCGGPDTVSSEPRGDILQRVLEAVIKEAGGGDLIKEGRARIQKTADFPELKDAVRAMSKSDVVFIVLTTELLKQSRVLLEIAAAYDICSRVIGVIFDAGEVSGGNVKGRQSSVAGGDPPLLTALLGQLEDREHTPVTAKATTRKASERRYCVPPGLDVPKMHNVSRILHNLLPTRSPLAPLVLINQSEVTSDPEKIAEIASMIVRMEEDVKPPQSALKEFEARQVITKFFSRRATRRRINARIDRKRDNMWAKKLRWKDNGDAVDVSKLLPLKDDKCYHIFLSHDWNSPAGRDVMRVLKDRLLELFPVRIERAERNAGRAAQSAAQSEDARKKLQWRRQLQRHSTRGAMAELSCTAPANKEGSDNWKMTPSCRVFLDVDDLDHGVGAEYVMNSELIVCYICETFFKARSALRELFYAVKDKKRIVALMECDWDKGGVTKKQAIDLLKDAHSAGYFGEADTVFGSAKFLEEVQHALFELEPVEWHRVLIFQETAVRQIVDRLLCKDVIGSKHRGEMYAKIDHSVPSKLPPPTTGYHIYVSPHNLGAMELVEEMKALFPKGTSVAELLVTDRIADIGECSHMLLYLHEQTWGDEQKAESLADDIEMAMTNEVGLILCHEGTHLCEPGEKLGCHFREFLHTNPKTGNPTTPTRLRDKSCGGPWEYDVYSEIAIPLRQGPARAPGLLNLVEVIAGKVSDRATRIPERAPQLLAAEAEDEVLLAQLRRQGKSWALNSAFRSMRDMTMAARTMNSAVELGVSVNISLKLSTPWQDGANAAEGKCIRATIAGPPEAVALLQREGTDTDRCGCYLSPPVPVTIHDRMERNKLGIPLDGELTFCYCYPPSSLAGKYDELMNDESLTEPWLFFLLVGGYCYFDSERKVVRLNALYRLDDAKAPSPDAIDDAVGGKITPRLRLLWRGAASEAALESLRKQQRLHEVTLMSLRNAGFVKFAWVNPGERPGPTPLFSDESDGAFVYEMDGGGTAIYAVQSGKRKAAEKAAANARRAIVKIKSTKTLK